MVKNLRHATGAGVMDAKRALDEANGDTEKATLILREQGLAAAEKRADRETSQGVIESYIHGGGRIGTLIELSCETDFVANTDEFRSLARDIAMQVAAMNPLVITKDERINEPEIEGTDEEIVLLEQPFIKDASLKVDDLVKEAILKTGENIRMDHKQSNGKESDTNYWVNIIMGFIVLRILYAIFKHYYYG